MSMDRRKLSMGTFRIFVLLFFIHYCLADIEVNTNAFKVWRQQQRTTQKNHIKLRFKTTQGSGLIMFAQGANKKDYLSIELYRGKIRVAANYGRGTENRLRPIGGFYDMYLGKDLADNEWHTVEFVRNIRESILYIDRGRGKMQRSSFMKSPPTYNRLSVGMVTFGGYYSFATSVLSTKKALSRKGFSACFSEATFHQTWPEDDPQKIDFLRQGNAIGTVLPNCPPPNPPYRPIFFSSSAVHITLVENYTIDSLMIEMKFRTVISDQTLANYTTIGSGQRIQLRLDRKGRVMVGIDIDDNMQVIETAKEGYHDGEWHNAFFDIDNKANDAGGYVVKFRVDGKTRLSALSREIKFNGYVNIGFGFTGCLRDIKINNEDIQRVSRNPNIPNDYFTIADAGIVYNSCSLKDYCNPNPCMNGGKCNQTEDNIVCDCRDTLYEGSTCHRARFNYTCAGVRKSGERRSDVYYIDFDGMGPMEPVRALCDLGRTVETTVTQVNNTKYMDIDVSTASGKNNVEINYQATIVQMRELITNSAFCTQYIKFTCKGTPLFRSPEGPPPTRWMGGDDILHYYWGGAENNRGYCACGLTANCDNRGKYCNCDDLNAQNNVKDEGNFTIKQHLPVREVQFTAVLKAQRLESLLSVGHLRCAGFGAHSIAATFRKPWSFLSVDHPDQPFDNIFSGQISFDFRTSVAYNYMVLAHAHGPFSGDYAKIMIWSNTMVRVHLNFGYGDLKQDVDISQTGRTLDDNQWHEFDMMFNMKELNVTLDGIRMIQGLPLQDDPVQFNVDDKAVYVGGSYHDKNGFIGCIRSFYVNGRIHDIRGVAAGQEDYGVYPGCGSACVLLNKPCNYGFCIDKYDAFSCNCSVSPYDGKYCQNETYPKKFSGSQEITYDMVKGNVSEPVGELIFVIGFKTTTATVALAQLQGNHGQHFSLVLMDGYLTLYWSMKKKVRSGNGVISDVETQRLQITTRKLNNNKHNIARVRFSTEEIFLTVPTYGYKMGDNVTVRPIDTENLNRGVLQDFFDVPTKFIVGKVDGRVRIGSDYRQPPSFDGCMSGAKLVYNPRATIRKHFRKSIEIDIFKMLQETGKASDNPTGPFPTVAEKCGPSLKIPGKLPTVGPARQFFTRSPGLDGSVKVKTVNTANYVIIFIIIIIVALVLLGFLFLIYNYVNRNRVEYNRLVKQEKAASKPPAHLMKSYPPPGQSNPPTTSIQQPSKSSAGPSGGGGGSEDNWFL